MCVLIICSISTNIGVSGYFYVYIFYMIYFVDLDAVYIPKTIPISVIDMFITKVFLKTSGSKIQKEKQKKKKVE